MSANLSRRIAAVETKTGQVQAARGNLPVRFRPCGLDDAALAEWQAGTSPAGLEVLFLPWPPRSPGDVRDCLRSQMADDVAGLAARVAAFDPYPGQSAALVALRS